MQVAAMRLLAFPIVFLLGCAWADECPPEEDVYPCTCDDDVLEDADLTLTCSGAGIGQDDVRNALGRLQGSQNVELVLDELEDLGKLRSDLFSGFAITMLEINHCDLDGLTDGEGPAFLGLEDTLRELVIVSSLNSPTELTLGHLRALKVVDISYNHLHHAWEAPPFAPDLPPSLQTLILSNNNIEEISDHAFSNLVDLESLSLDGNRFGDVRRSLFPQPASRLRTLELDNNDLRELPVDLFAQMPVLKDVSLSTNNIRQLERQTWRGVWPQLRRLSLHGNPLSCDSHMNWISAAELGVSLFGTCHEPEEMRGIHLQDFILSRSPVPRPRLQ